jgi:hypothetical protein
VEEQLPRGEVVADGDGEVRPREERRAESEVLEHEHGPPRRELGEQLAEAVEFDGTRPCARRRDETDREAPLPAGKEHFRGERFRRHCDAAPAERHRQRRRPALVRLLRVERHIEGHALGQLRRAAQRRLRLRRRAGEREPEKWRRERGRRKRGRSSRCEEVGDDPAPHRRERTQGKMSVTPK